MTLVIAEQETARRLLPTTEGVTPSDDPREPEPCVWIGPDYGPGCALGRKLLLLAEPQARGPSDLRQVGRGFEARSVGDYISGRLKHLQFTAAARVLLGGPAEREACEAFFRQVAFSNDVARWPELLEQLAPDALLVMGLETWRDLAGGVPEAFGGRRFDYAGGSCWAAAVPHPGSRGFEFRDHVASGRRLLELPRAAAGVPG